MSQKYPFKRKNSVGSQKWYELIGFNYNSRFQNNRNKTNGDLKVRGGIQHNFSTSASPKIGYVSITPNFNTLKGGTIKELKSIPLESIP